MNITTQETENGNRIVRAGTSEVKIIVSKAGDYTRFRLSWKVGSRTFRRAYSDESKALQEADRIVRKLYSADGSATTISGEDVVYLRECQRKLGRVPLHEAVDFYLAYHNAKSGVTKTFEEVAEEFLAYMIRMKTQTNEGVVPKKDRYLETLRTHINTWESVFGKREISTISAKVISDQLLEEKNGGWGKKYSITSRENFLGTLGTIMRYAQTKSYIGKDILPTKGIKLPQKKLKTPEYFTPDELKRIFIAFPAESIPYLAIMAFSGGRRAEIEKAVGDQINLVDGKIFVPPEHAKKNSGRGLRINSNLDLWLKEFAPSGKIVESPLVTCPYKFKDELKAAGVKWKNNGLRKSFITYRLEESGNSELVSRVSGNSTAMLDKHYAASNATSADAAAWFSITPQSVREYASEKKLDGLLTW